MAQRAAHAQRAGARACEIEHMLNLVSCASATVFDQFAAMENM
jgi:hypothetical protein